MLLPRLTALLFIFSSSVTWSAGTVTPEPDANNYSFVSHYKITINASPEVVWPQLIALEKWMYEFELSRVAGEPGQPGEVRRLYEGQDFYMQVTKAVPNEVLVVSNLPSVFKGEASTGIGVMTLTTVGPDVTVVNLTMSRRYQWQGEGENPFAAQRNSQAFNENTDAMWGRFLKRLALISTGADAK